MPCFCKFSAWSTMHVHEHDAIQNKDSPLAFPAWFSQLFHAKPPPISQRNRGWHTDCSSEDTVPGPHERDSVLHVSTAYKGAEHILKFGSEKKHSMHNEEPNHTRYAPPLYRGILSLQTDCSCTSCFRVGPMGPCTPSRTRVCTFGCAKRWRNVLGQNNKVGH